MWLLAPFLRPLSAQFAPARARRLRPEPLPSIAAASSGEGRLDARTSCERRRRSRRGPSTSGISRSGISRSAEKRREAEGTVSIENPSRRARAAQAEAYYPPERHSAVVDVIGAKTGALVKQIPGGFKGVGVVNGVVVNGQSGPNGVGAAFPWLFVPGAPSRVVSIDLRTDTVVSS